QLPVGTPAGEPGGVTPVTWRPSALTPPSIRRRDREAERRQVTVLVSGCDLFESEAYLGLDAEDQARVLGAFRQACGQAVGRVGEARNVAVRLEEVGAPGRVVCSEATHRLIRDQFRCASLGVRKVKGVAQPVGLFEVQGAGEARSPLEAAGPAGLTPLTGRDHE